MCDSDYQSYSDLYKYVTYKPRDGDAAALVSSKLLPIYHYPHKESLHAAVDIHLVDITWCKELTWRNDTEVEQTYEYQYTVDMKVTEGSEVVGGINLAASFEGLRLVVGDQFKVFTSHETTRGLTKSIMVKVPANSSLHLYQRRYTLKTNMFFVIDAWGQVMNVGSWGNIARKGCTVVISSEDFFSTSTALDSSVVGMVMVGTVDRLTKETDRETRKWDDCTDMARKALQKMGL